MADSVAAAGFVSGPSPGVGHGIGLMALRRILGIDYGRKRLGLAISDPLAITAQPLAMIEVRGLQEALDRMVAIALEHEVGAVVVGLPRNMDGTEGPMAVEARKFAGELRVRLGFDVTVWDERLTSREAGRSLGRAGARRRQRKELLDVVAAQLLLQSYLDRRPSPPSKSEEDTPK
ncbi:MAG: Holliday junction resolvase RuvX [Planctomycetota bacterium]